MFIVFVDFAIDIGDVSPLNEDGWVIELIEESVVYQMDIVILDFPRAFDCLKDVFRVFVRFNVVGVRHQDFEDIVMYLVEPGFQVWYTDILLTSQGYLRGDDPTSEVC